MVAPEDLIRIYPWMDHMLAETLIKAHENGTLAERVKSWPEVKWQPPQTTVISRAQHALS